MKFLVLQKKRKGIKKKRVIENQITDQTIRICKQPKNKEGSLKELYANAPNYGIYKWSRMEFAIDWNVWIKFAMNM